MSKFPLGQEVIVVKLLDEHTSRDLIGQHGVVTEVDYVMYGLTNYNVKLENGGVSYLHEEELQAYEDSFTFQITSEINSPPDCTLTQEDLMEEKLFEVTIEDLTGLGGPMGTEHTEEIGSAICGSKAVAVYFIKEWLRKNDQLDRLSAGVQNLSDDQFIKAVRDLGSVGFTVRPFKTLMNNEDVDARIKNLRKRW